MAASKFRAPKNIRQSLNLSPPSWLSFRPRLRAELLRVPVHSKLRVSRKGLINAPRAERDRVRQMRRAMSATGAKRVRRFSKQLAKIKLFGAKAD